MHIFDADLIAISNLKDIENFAEGGSLQSTKAASNKLTVEIPHSQIIEREIEFRVIGGLSSEGVEGSDKVSTYAIHIDQLEYAGLFFDLIGIKGRGKGAGLIIGHPFNGLSGDMEIVKDILIEILITEEKLMDFFEEEPGFSALYNAMVIGGGNIHNLRNSESGDSRGRHSLILSGVLNRADGDDSALPDHEARDREDGADSAGVSKSNGSAGKFSGIDLSFAGAPDEIVVCKEELFEGHGLCIFDIRDDERAGAVLFFEIDSESEVNGRSFNNIRDAI